MNLLHPKKTTSRRTVLRAVIPWLAGTHVLDAFGAQDAVYPSRPLRLILPFATGGVPDVAARLIGEKLALLMGQPVVIDNRPGASGLLAVQQLKLASADGHTLLYADNSTWATTPAMKQSPGYDPEVDLVPVSRTATMKFYLFASAAFPINSVRDLVAVSKATPGGLSYGTPGVGSMHHLAMERLRLATGANLVHVPFKGIAQVVLSLATGDVAATVSTPLPFQPQLQAGRVKTIAVGSTTRSPLNPDIPSLGEADIKDIEIRADQGIFVRRDTPEPIVQRLNTELRKVLADAELRRKMGESGVEMVASSPQQLAALVRTDLQSSQRIIQAAGIPRE